MATTTLRSLLALAFLAAANGLVVGGTGQRSISQPVKPRIPVPAFMDVSDKEFEEWARKKKIASGVDPDEDFGAGRRAESTIYLVGGLIAVIVPTVAGIWAYNEGYLTPQ